MQIEITYGAVLLRLWCSIVLEPSVMRESLYHASRSTFPVSGS